MRYIGLFILLLGIAQACVKPEAQPELDHTWIEVFEKEPQTVHLPGVHVSETKQLLINKYNQILYEGKLVTQQELEESLLKHLESQHMKKDACIKQLCETINSGNTLKLKKWESALFFCLKSTEKFVQIPPVDIPVIVQFDQSIGQTKYLNWLVHLKGIQEKAKAKFLNQNNWKNLSPNEEKALNILFSFIERPSFTDPHEKLPLPPSMPDAG